MLVVHPRAWAEERSYTARVLLGDFLGLDVETAAEERVDTELRLDGRSVRLRDGLFATPEADRLTEGVLPRAPLARRDGVPVLWPTDDELGIDVLGGSFFLLTRLEEVVRGAADEHGRFPAAATLAAREGFLRRPLVNEYLELLWRALRETWPRLDRVRHEFRVVPSHDVDWPLAPERSVRELARRVGSDLLRHREPGTALRRVRGYASRRAGKLDLDVHNVFDWIMETGERRGLRSTFFFIGASSGGWIDGGYSLDDPWIRALLRRVHVRGHEIGLHGSYATYLDPAQTRAERDTLARVCAEERILQSRWGGRQHFLRWRAPQTWRNYADAGLDYDTTLGFPDEVGFRSGVCHEHAVFDVERRRELPLRELPLVAMEMAALDTTARADDAFRQLEEVKAACRRHGGSFTLLWHNSRLVYPSERRLYEAVLDT